MPAQKVRLLAVCLVPETDGGLVAAGSEKLTVAAEGHGRDRAGVTGVWTIQPGASAPACVQIGVEDWGYRCN
jgi:hypothetical protein